MSPGDDNNQNTEEEKNINPEDIRDESPPDEADNQGDYENLKSNYDELHNRFIRLAADFDNYKKRVVKEKSELSIQANEELLRELLIVIDNLKLAIDHADPEGDLSSTVEGIKLVYNLLLSTLQKFGLTAIESSKGTEFDPRLHQALERIETEEITPGLILDEMIRGYLFKDRLLRPASVTVSTNIININKKSAGEDVEDQEGHKIEINDDDDVDTSDENVFDLTEEDYD